MRINRLDNVQPAQFYPTDSGGDRPLVALVSPSLLREGSLCFFPANPPRSFRASVFSSAGRKRPYVQQRMYQTSASLWTTRTRIACRVRPYDYRALDARRDASTNDIETTPPLTPAPSPSSGERFTSPYRQTGGSPTTAPPPTRNYYRR